MQSPRWLTAYLDYGIDGQPPKERRRIRAANLGSLFGAVPTLGFAIGYAVADHRKFWLGSVINLCSAIGYMTPPVLAAKGYRKIAASLFVTVAFTHLSLITLYLGTGAGFHLYFLLLGPLSILLTPVELHAWRSLTVILAPICFVVLLRYASDGWVPVAPETLFMLHVNSGVLATLIIAGIVAFFANEAADAEQRYEREYARSEALLLNVLPPAIAARLKSGEVQVADRFAEVSVLFADLVGFTPLSAKLPPEEVVKLLNRVFTRFDELAERFQLEKIKTIGDAYMVVGGLPQPSADHLERIARMALAMNDEVAALSRAEGEDLAVRIGIHAGPVVAGVIGKKKFNYDLWGDTVNTASRMESHGVPGEIQVTAAVKDRLAGRGFVFEERGTIDVKGKGAIATYLLKPRARGAVEAPVA